MKKMEHELQKGCVNWFRYQYPNHLIYAIPNGGQRNIIVASILKAEGVLSGVPDLHIPVARQGYHGLYVEMKIKREKPTKNQLSVMEKLTGEGYKCEVCRSLAEFMKIINDYLL